MTEQIPDGARLLGDIVEVVRYEERVVVTKQVVAVERVRLVRRVITAEQVVGGQVRREVVDLDRTGTPGPTRTGTPPPPPRRHVGAATERPTSGGNHTTRSRRHPAHPAAMTISSGRPYPPARPAPPAAGSTGAAFGGKSVS
jgi:hypothetical protein